MQETFHGVKTPPQPSQYTAVSATPVVPISSTRPSRGVVTLIKNTVPYRQINIVTNLEAIAIRANIKNTEYTICNIYISPTEPISTDQITQLTDQLPTPFLLVGDFNARSELWGDTVTNGRGTRIEHLLSTTELCVINGASPTHFHIQTMTESCIDLTIVSPDIFDDFSWNTAEDLYNSDHFPILLTKTLSQAPPCPVQNYNFDKADWTKFRRLTIVPNEVFIDQLDIDAMVSLFNNLILSAADQAIPKKNSTGKYPVPWWNRECSRTTKNRKSCLRRYRRTRVIEDKIALNRATAIARKTQRTARRDSWKIYVSSINKKTPILKIFKKVRKISGKYNGQKATALEDNGLWISDQQEVSNIMGEHFAEISSPRFYTDEFNNLRIRAEQTDLNFTSPNNESYNQQITKAELTCALQTCGNTAPGEDEICYPMLKNLSESATKLLLHIFNRVYLNESFPSLWRKSILLTFLKPGKPETNKNSYRPISLTSSTCKLLEKIINHRLTYTLESINFFSPCQYGFRKARSTLEPLCKLQSEICKAFKDKKYLVAIFFDIQKAYDTTWRYHILRTLHNSGIRGHLAIFIRNFLRERQFRVKVGNCLSEPYIQEQGVPQGSVLSCTLFGMAINDIVKDIPVDVHKSLFVDDLAIYYSSALVPSLERQLQISINKILNFTNKAGFKISAEKTVAIQFHRKTGMQQEPQLRIGDSNIMFQPHAKFLGLIFDQRLHWKEHINYLRGKCLRSLNLIKMLSKIKWGADRCSLLKIYRSTTRTQLDYGCQIYASAPPRILQRLDAIHHLGIRLATGAFKSSPIASIMADTGEMKLEERRKQLVLQLNNRQQRLPFNPSSDFFNDSYSHISHSKPFGALAFELTMNLNLPTPPILHHTTPAEPPWLLPIDLECKLQLPRTKKDLPPHIVKGYVIDHQDINHQNSYHIYTDGSKSEEGAGYGVFSDDFSLRVRIPNQASIYTAELLAILAALRHISEVQHRNSVIFTDSRSCIEGIANLRNAHPIISKIQTYLVRLHRSNAELKLCWCPGHVGVIGNEQADRLAREAVTNEVDSYEALPHSDINPIIKRSIKTKWEDKWTTEHQGNKLREIKEDTSDWNINYPRRRHLEVILCRLRIGHTKLTHGHLMEGRPPDLCEGCDDTQLTIKHILCDCPLYNSARISCFNSQHPQIREILGRNAPMNDILQFLNITGLTNKI